jgi:PAS domain S-box-containing protein
MTKTPRFKLVLLLHILALSGIFYVGSILKNERSAEKVNHRLEQLKSITNTLALMPSSSHMMELVSLLQSSDVIPEGNFSYTKVSQELKKIIEVNHLQGYELSFITFNQGDKKFYRVVSNDVMYTFKDEIKDPDGKIKKFYSKGSTNAEEMSDAIQKYIVFSPVINELGMTAGILRLSSPDMSAELNTAVIGKWPFLLALCYILIVILITPGLIKKSKGKHEKHRGQLNQELKKKDVELKMLSLVAKKSENLIVITDSKGVILWVNETNEHKNNYSAEELSTFTGKFLPDVSKNIHIRTIIRNVVDFKKSVVYESKDINDKGQNYYSMTTVTPIKDELDLVTNLLFVDTDITKIKSVEKENIAFKKFVELSCTPRIFMKRTGEVTYCNETALPLLNKWKGDGDSINSTILSLIQSICDANCMHAIEYRVNDKYYKVNFYPDSGNRELHILAEELIGTGVEKREKTSL